MAAAEGGGGGTTTLCNFPCHLYNFDNIIIILSYCVARARRAIFERKRGKVAPAGSAGAAVVECRDTLSEHLVCAPGLLPIEVIL